MNDAVSEFITALNKRFTKHCEVVNQNRRYRKVLEQLARLGNGNTYGNSIGNKIAIECLKKESEE